MDTKNLFRPKGLKVIDSEIERLATTLSGMEPTDSNYPVIAGQLKLLCEAREKRNDRVISNEAILAAAVNIAGLLIVLNFEKAGIITSKAFGLIGLKKQ